MRRRDHFPPSPTPRLDLVVAVLEAVFAVLWWCVCLLLRISLYALGAIIGFVIGYRTVRRGSRWS